VTTRRSLAALALALAWACGDDEKPSPPITGPSDAGESSGGASGSSGSSGTGGSDGGEPNGGTGAAAGEGAQGASGGRGGTAGAPRGGAPSGGAAGAGGGVPMGPSDAAAGAPPEDLTTLCSPEGAWGPLVDLPLMDGAAQLVGITPDELTIGFYGVENMAPVFYVADRASVSVNFDPGVAIEERGYVALSPDGLRLVALAEGRFLELVRTGRGQPFGAPDEGTFSTLDADADDNDLAFLGAVIAPDDRALYYLVSDGQSDQPLHVSRRTGAGPWPVGTRIEACEFQTHDGLVREPTGVSADGLTVFFNDPVRGQARAAFRETPSGPFVWFVDLGSRPRSQPNAPCNRLYFTEQSGPAYAEAQ
jgi:hypothetical protein